jgi:hypothetical protein
MKFCPVVPEICRGQVHGPRKERRKRIIIRNGAKTIDLKGHYLPNRNFLLPVKLSDMIHSLIKRVSVINVMKCTHIGGKSRYDNVTLIPLVLQLGLRIGPIQRMGAN